MSKWYATRQMTHCLVVVYSFCFLLRHVLADETCLIHATLFVTPLELRQEQDFGLPLDIDCSNANNSRVSGTFDLGAQRVAGKLHVLLDGSQTSPLNTSSYGLEYLDNCAQLQSLQIERFVGDVSLGLSCNGFKLESMRQVYFHHNELGTLSGISFELLPQLKQLHLEENSLKLIESFSGCKQLEQLNIRKERQLALRQSDILLQLRQVQRVELTQLKLIEAPVLEELPGQLKELLVQTTPITPHQFKIFKGSEQLINLTLCQCELTLFTLESESFNLLHLNLSGNALRQLQIFNSSSLLSLDLSSNHLSSLNRSWFVQMPRLQKLQLQQNRLHSISMLQLLQLSPVTLSQLDLSHNELLRLEQTENTRWDQMRQLRIQIDGNPWSCQWLLNFSHAQPELFRLFSYDKYISQINVNGLSCTPQLEEDPPQTNSNRSQQLINASNRNAHLNVSSHTVLYGNPVQQSHSQRSEALIIVFMLPFGIALLFLLLYLYLHCERLFHWSYYSSGLRCFGGNKSSRAHRFVDHIDIVRYPVANASMGIDLEPQPDGYETPLSGSASICNCAGHRQSSCSRTHHVTYETMPTELPYQLYAEIKEQIDSTDADQTLAETAASTMPIYDHLSYEEEKPLEV
ncbi:leucine-rich repeat neuronal protein 1 [Drosophila innubila]|uniref:leucine-rich repeat neuronal protein 1 n=1 Tax=Drosophila innubila TaxID=198719 RepID=UPI00148C335B|nr:leucine-rich repeat neuronal protein 1 [Drosophila innubila]